MPENILNVLCSIGTRPEVIKMAPVVWKIRQQKNMRVTVIITAQHRQLIDDVLTLFNIQPDFDLNIMQENQSLSTLTGNLFLKLEPLIDKDKYDIVLAQGDTTTTLVTAQISFYKKIPFGHIEAGLRTYNFRNPFPEEMNRVFISKLSDIHFAPTDLERKILENENINSSAIYVTGNTVIDALYYWAEKNTPLPFSLPENKKIILLTLHRRESFGAPMQNIFSALLELVKKHDDIHIIYPVHPNPNINKMAYEMLDQHPSISLIKSLAYDKFVTLMKHAYLICTDSGGLQEEAPALNKPLIVLRDETERPLVVSLGLARLGGTNKNSVLSSIESLVSDIDLYRQMQKNISPYGDGHAAERIVQVIKEKIKPHY